MTILWGGIRIEKDISDINGFEIRFFTETDIPWSTRTFSVALDKRRIKDQLPSI
jgi:hypothetical protein